MSTTIAAAGSAEGGGDELLQQIEQEQAAMKIQSVHRGNAARNKLAARLSRKEADLREAEPDTESLDMQALRALKKPELRKRAAEMGASEEEIEAARDEDDEKAAMLRLIVAHADAQASHADAAPPDVRFEDIREIEGSVRLVRHLESMTERVSKKFRDQLQYARERDNLLLCKDAKGEVRMPPFVHPRSRLPRAPLLLLCAPVGSSRSQRRGHAQQRVAQLMGQYDEGLTLYLEYAPGGSLKDLLRNSPQGLRCAQIHSTRVLSGRDS